MWLVAVVPLLRVEHGYPVEGLVEWPGNPRKHDENVLDESVADHGQFRNVLARELPDGRLQLLAGHGTREALIRAGITHIDVEVRAVPDDDRARRIVLIENRSGDRARYDHSKLLDLLDEARATPHGLDGTGWDAQGYDDLLAAHQAPDLDDLAGQVGDPTDEDRMVVIRVLVDPSTRDQFNRLMSLVEGAASDAEKFSGVLAWAAVGARADGLDTMP